MKLIFDDSNGDERIIGEYDSYEEAMIQMKTYIKELNAFYKIPYTKIQFVKSSPLKRFSRCRLMFSVGSPVEFFYLDDLNLDAFMHLNEIGIEIPEEVLYS